MAPNNHGKDKDKELFNIFIEEAYDLNQSIALNLLQWKEDISNSSPLMQIKRDLHTLKGGARMMEQNVIASLAHDLETYCDTILTSKKSVSTTQYNLMAQLFDHLSLMIEGLKKGEKIPYPTELIDALAKDLKKDTREAPAVGPAKDEGVKGAIKEQIQTKDEVIRVRASLLESLNNISLEENMSRIRLEQQLKMSESLLNEMKLDDNRLLEQIELLEKELLNIIKPDEFNRFQKNILEKDNLEKKVPTTLESMLARLRDVVNDSGNLLKTLNDVCLNMENLLAAQSRSHAELQNKLTGSRLVSFETIVPRLTKIVRQISSELNKMVDFKVGSVEGEMDRTALEHLLPSLEHILRNAIDHGIEASEKRKEHGKSTTGKVEIEFKREGGSVLIKIHDDGKGIDFNAVRKKAIALGKIDPKKTVSEADLLHLILEPGFSTKETLTEISGRGVGLDVVNASIKEMGGLLSIDSEKDKGTTFLLRFPFNTSLNRVLLFKVGDQTFGIMLSEIAGVARIDALDLPSLLEKKKPVVVFEKKPYYLQYIRLLIEKESNELFFEKRVDYPVILIASPEYPMALLVDELLYSKELIIQTLGAQFKFLDECSGATLLGDGSVVLILDPQALVKKASQRVPEEKKALEISTTRKIQPGIVPLIMIVDDSMTIRTVTKRFLERHRFKTMTAQDGVEALEKLEELVPHLILLDIDMPRMDGFEFATVVRSDDRFKDVPIIVITSRPSEKHRKEAEVLKLNAILEKPFQEEKLLELIEELLGERT